MLENRRFDALPALTYPGNYPNSMSLFIVSPFSFPFVLKKKLIVISI